MAKPASTTARGYGAQHQRERRRWQIIVDRDGYICTRCHRYAPPGTPFDLDHTDQRDGYTGAAHTKCNRGAGGRKARARERLRLTQPWRSRNW